jgi:hypothetical protein
MPETPKESMEMGRLTRGKVWEDFQKLVTDLDSLLPLTDERFYHPLTIALEREDGARFIIYRRGVTSAHVHGLFDYAEEHLEVERTIRRAPGQQAQAAVANAPISETEAQPTEEICACKTRLQLARQAAPSH